jgi:hypothetical protein
VSWALGIRKRGHLGDTQEDSGCVRDNRSTLVAKIKTKVYIQTKGPAISKLVRKGVTQVSLERERSSLGAVGDEHSERARGERGSQESIGVDNLREIRPSGDGDGRRQIRHQSTSLASKGG